LKWNSGVGEIENNAIHSPLGGVVDLSSVVVQSLDEESRRMGDRGGSNTSVRKYEKDIQE
jgi:hypothetical protein